MILSHEQQQQIATIFSWDLSKPKLFLVIRKNLDPAHVEAMDNEYRRYMALVVVNFGQKMPISNAVDELWHAHILFTQDYQKMSDELCGKYINHVPTLSEEERAALEPYYFDGTLENYKKLFNEDPCPEFWPSESGSICWSCS